MAGGGTAHACRRWAKSVTEHGLIAPGCPRPGEFDEIWRTLY